MIVQIVQSVQHWVSERQIPGVQVESSFLIITRPRSRAAKASSGRTCLSQAVRHLPKPVTPEVLQFINELVVQAAVELGLEDAKQLRVDTTVVQTDIHHPTDSALLWDAVRVITRLVQRLGEIIPPGVSTFHHRTRAAKRRHQQIQRVGAPIEGSYGGANVETLCLRFNCSYMLSG